MITKAWLDCEIEQAVAAEPSRKSVYDLAALLTVRYHLYHERPPERDSMDAGYSFRAEPVQEPEEPLTLDAIEYALASYAGEGVRTPEERQRVRDAQTIISIIKGRGAE